MNPKKRKRDSRLALVSVRLKATVSFAILINSREDDSDDDSDTSYDSDDTVEQDMPTYTDVAARPSKIKSPISQKAYLVETKIRLPPYKSNSGETTPQTLNLLHHTIRQNDTEAFRHIVKLYKSAKNEPIPLDDATLACILQYDRPDMLDEFIRRSGLGLAIEVHHGSDQEGETPVVLNDKNRVYLGLNVHGKKRGDLAKRGDPNAVHSDGSEEIPLVWRAAQAGATAVIQYLLTDRPLAAYKHYSISHNDERAIKIRRASLEKVLPDWLGWKVNSLGESPYAAAVLSNKLETVKAIFTSKLPQIPKTAVHNRWAFSIYAQFSF